MPEYNLNELAEADIREIWDYIVERDGPTRADSIVDAIFDRFPLLAEQPYMGVARPEFDLPGLRSLVVRNTPYIIFYYPRDYGVEVVHVIHGSRNLHRLFEH